MKIQRIAIVAVSLCLASCAVRGQAVRPDSYSKSTTFRYPVVTVPQGPRPTLSGNVGDTDAADKAWKQATRLHDFVTLEPGSDNGIAAREQTEVWLSYSTEALHVGFRMEMPEGTAPKIETTSGRDVGMSDEAFEIFLTTSDQDSEQFHIGGNAAGVLWERRFDQGNLNWSWNPAIQYKTKVVQGAWQGEMIIPFAELGVDAPRPGDVWRANFLSNRRTPSARLDAWSYGKEWRDPGSNGRIIFGKPQQPFFKMQRGWQHTWKGKGLSGGLFFPRRDQDHKMEFVFNIMRREAGEGRASQSFLSDLQSRRDKADGEGATFAPFEQDVQDALKGYKVIREFKAAKTLPDPNFKSIYGPTRYTLDQPGDYIYNYYVKDITDPRKPMFIAGGAVPFRIRAGAELEVMPYLLSRRSVVLTGDLRGVEDRNAVAGLRGYIAPVGDQSKVLAQAKAQYDGAATIEVEVPVADLPVGKYEAHLQLLDQDGQAIDETTAPFTKPQEPDWWINRDKYGSTPEVPVPWTPIVWNNGVAKVWGREITFGNSPLPQQIVNQGQKLLAEPIRLELKVGGKVLAWGKPTSKVLEQRPGHLLIETSQEAGGVRVRGKTRFEFDGFSLVDLTIEPIDRTANLDGLDLVLTLPAKHAEFLTNYRKASGPGKDVTRYVGKTPDHYESAAMLQNWLGTDDYGLELTMESTRGWSLENPDKSAEIARRDDLVEMRLHFIDHPITLDKARHIRFGLVATPVKSVAVERRNWRIDYAGAWAPLTDGTQRISPTKFATQKDFDEWQKFYGGLEVDILVRLVPYDWSGYKAWHPYVTDPEIRRRLKAHWAPIREMGMKTLINGGWAVSPSAPEWNPWGKEMTSRPLEPTFAGQYLMSYNSPYVEFMVGSFARNARELGITGIRFDTVFPWQESKNPYLDETWVSDTDGQTYGTYSLFRQREFTKKMYRIFHGGEVEDGVLHHPLAGPPIMAVESCMDIHETTEGFDMKAPSLKVAYPQDAVRVWMTGKQYGFVELNSLKGAPLKPNQRAGALMAAGASPRMSPRFNTKGYELDEVKMPVRQIWDAWSWINRGTAQWHGHWANKDKIATTGNGEHYVSFWLQPGRRVLLVATNYEQARQNVKIDLNPEKLGFKPGTVLKVVDAVTWESVPMQGNTLQLTLEPELYRLLKIAPQAELDGPNLDPAHPRKLTPEMRDFDPSRF